MSRAYIATSNPTVRVAATMAVRSITVVVPIRLAALAG
jgi:hypothetical protein